MKNDPRIEVSISAKLLWKKTPKDAEEEVTRKRMQDSLDAFIAVAAASFQKELESNILSSDIISMLRKSTKIELAKGDF